MTKLALSVTPIPQCEHKSSPNSFAVAISKLGEFPADSYVTQLDACSLARMNAWKPTMSNSEQRPNVIHERFTDEQLANPRQKLV